LNEKINRMQNIDLRLSISWRDSLITVGILVITTALCFLLNQISTGGDYPHMLFLVSVLLISRFTDGYLYGIVASFLGVICVNFVFTYPYFEFNFTLTGYPLTFLCMLTTSILTCATTAQFKRSEKIRAEINEEKLRGNLLRAISHDLRTPLTSIVGSLQAVIENRQVISEEDRIKLLTEAKDDAQWLIRMVENLLSITRVTSSPAAIKKTPEAAEEVVGDAVGKIKRRFPAVEVTVSVPDELLLVPMDPLLIEQVLENLMENSVLHGQKTTRINVSVRSLGGNALFTLMDDGAGIDPAVMEHLFDGRLIHNASREADSKKNMGIGLSVCMSIVRAHGGDMTASNIPQGGATFQFTLPLKERSEDEQ